ncbi:MAG: hypothetical protein K5840_05545 [Eubacterium sp.]|nr:hypothetical protein [Eubacterium sp.]
MRNRIVIITFVAVMVFFVVAVSRVSAGNTSAQRDDLESAINRCVVECYALEGTYPPSLSYMKENYGLVYNEELFFVDYTVYGTNLWPDITIIERQE